MTLSPLLRADSTLLAQHLLTCPGCHKPAAAHVDITAPSAVLVRFVCPDGCAVDEAVILGGLAAETASPDPSPLSAVMASG